MEPVFRGWYERKMLATPSLARETELVAQILREVRIVAIVGISKDEHKDSHYVGRYLKHAGYRIVPVNPTASRILGEHCFADVREIPFAVDVVDIFRRPADAAGVVRDALTIGPRVVWLQLGSGTHDDLLPTVWRSGCIMIQNRCMKVDHQFLLRNHKVTTNNNHQRRPDYGSERKAAQLPLRHAAITRGTET